MSNGAVLPGNYQVLLEPKRLAEPFYCGRRIPISHGWDNRRWSVFDWASHM